MADAKYYATGKRKTAIARVWIKPGSGIITVNEQDPEAYFGDALVRKILERPFVLTDTAAKFDVVATMKGGGKSAQSDAMRHGIAKALLEINPEYRVTLKKAGFLTRDPRAKERKKYGQRAARARFQFSKR